MCLGSDIHWVISMFRKRKELEEFSHYMEQLLNDGKLDFRAENKDMLPSKIRHQFIRLSEKIYGNEKQLKKERDDIRELIAEIAHQMRNPLTNMESYLELLGETESETEREQYMDALKKTECKLHFLTESFIKMARMENRIIQITPKYSSLVPTILQSVLKVKKAADAKNIFIDVQIDEGLCVSHDSNWLEEAVFNLLENSVKYSPPDSTVKISAVRNEMYTRISVSDSGCGICEGEEALIFGRFYRGKGTEREPGFGLGLYLSREIVLMHGGFMKARRKSRGLEISIFLP